MNKLAKFVVFETQKKAKLYLRVKRFFNGACDFEGWKSYLISFLNLEENV